MFYRPPGSDINVLDNLYSALCNIDVSLFSHFILIGDFNVDVMSPNRPLFSKLMNITSSFLWSQIVTEPNASVPSIIDLAFVSSPTNVIACNTISLLSTSDHMGISISYKMPFANKRPRSSQREVWCYSLGDFEKACEMLEEINWECIIDKTDIDVSWRNWQSTFLSVNDCVPRKTSQETSPMDYSQHHLQGNITPKLIAQSL